MKGTHELCPIKKKKNGTHKLCPSKKKDRNLTDFKNGKRIVNSAIITSYVPTDLSVHEFCLPQKKVPMNCVPSKKKTFHTSCVPVKKDWKITINNN